jgi:dUTP pyrophosphatase
MNIKAGFEKISKYADDEGVKLPTRKTKCSAGYDMYVAEDTVVPSWSNMIETQFANDLAKDLSTYYGSFEEFIQSLPYDLETTETLIKKYGKKTTLVPMGVKAYMPDDWYLQLSMRSSMPHKHWLMIANAPGIIDADYYNNPDNEGHFSVKLLNLGDKDFEVKIGDKIAQGVFMKYLTVDDEKEIKGKRKGGFGSTGK